MNPIKKLLKQLRQQLPAPRLQITMTQELHTLAQSPSYRLVHLAVTIHNRSEFATLRGAVLTATLAQLAPLTDAEVEILIQYDQENPAANEGSRYAWPPLPPGIGPHPALPERIPPDRRITGHFTFQIPAEVTCVQATVLLRPAAPADAPVPGKPPQSWQQISNYDFPVHNLPVRPP